jgi:hypothetical protein
MDGRKDGRAAKVNDAFAGIPAAYMPLAVHACPLRAAGTPGHEVPKRLPGGSAGRPHARLERGGIACGKPAGIGTDNGLGNDRNPPEALGNGQIFGGTSQSPDQFTIEGDLGNGVTEKIA